MSFWNDLRTLFPSENICTVVYEYCADIWLFQNWIAPAEKKAWGILDTHTAHSGVPARNCHARVREIVQQVLGHPVPRSVWNMYKRQQSFGCIITDGYSILGIRPVQCKSWTFPKGKMELIDEGSEIKTATREVYEETGLVVNVDTRPINPELFVRSKNAKWFFVETSTATTKCLASPSPKEVAEVKWIPLCSTRYVSFCSSAKVLKQVRAWIASRQSACRQSVSRQSQPTLSNHDRGPKEHAPGYNSIEDGSFPRAQSRAPDRVWNRGRLSVRQPLYRLRGGSWRYQPKAVLWKGRVPQPRSSALAKSQ